MPVGKTYLTSTLYYNYSLSYVMARPPTPQGKGLVHTVESIKRKYCVEVKGFCLICLHCLSAWIQRWHVYYVLQWLVSNLWVVYFRESALKCWWTWMTMIARKLSIVTGTLTQLVNFPTHQISPIPPKFYKKKKTFTPPLVFRPVAVFRLWAPLVPFSFSPLQPVALRILLPVSGTPFLPSAPLSSV